MAQRNMECMMCVFMFLVHGHCGPTGSLSGPSYLVGPRSGVPHLCGSGWGVSGVSGVSWVSGFGGRVCVRGVRRFVCGGEGLVFVGPSARASSRCRSASLGVGKRRERFTS